jgi:UDP-N-acetylmuramate dehydrogenase
VEGGMKLKEIVKFCLKEGLTGLEWAAGIPGTIGGAVYGNISAFGSSMSDLVEKVKIFDVKKEKVKTLSKKDCQFSPKQSIFKKQKNLVILSCLLKLKKGKKREIEKRIKEFLDYRKKNHPLEFPSAGCVFQNPKKISAAELIEKAGLKGKKIGDAKISPKHANFIVNLEKATAKDVLELINLIKNKVKKKFGIKLKEEIQFLPPTTLS